MQNLSFVFIICTKESHAVPVDINRAFRPSLIKSLPKAPLKLRDEDVP